MTSVRVLVTAVLLAWGAGFSASFAQAPKKPNAADIRLALEKLNVLGSVLYFAAHPDDENTRLIAYLANERKYRTGYLSLTRGDGGQNLIGPEIREELGIIRTQELLQARRVDGGEQFFSRANDFGFSKNPAETFTIWDREQVLADAVWVIRKFRPDVIITRFSPQPSGTHGHHTASAMIAQEAFDAAADPKRFPEQLKTVEPWQAKRLLWNTSSFFYSPGQKFDAADKLMVETGVYSPLLGRSYNEIAAQSRSMHKSQGFGSSGTRGEAVEYFEFLKGAPAKKDLAEGVNTSWNRVPGSQEVANLLQEALKKYQVAAPAASVPVLLKAHSALAKLPASYWKTVKQQELQEVIKACLGLYLEASSVKDYSVSPDEPVTLSIEAVNRSQVPVTLTKVDYLFAGKDTTVQQKLEESKPWFARTTMTIPAATAYSQPYWLRQPGSTGMFKVEDPAMIGQPENTAPAQVRLHLNVQGQPFIFTVPVVYKRTDPVEGEQYRPFEVTPPVFVNITEKVYVFADAQPKPVTVRVRAGKDQVAGQVTLRLPQGWRAEPATAAVSLAQKGEEQTFTFMVTPGAAQIESELGAAVTSGGKTYTQSLRTIQYPHIPTQTLLPEAVAKAVKLDLKRKGQYIGYLMGAGDEVPASLQQIGYAVDQLQVGDLSAAALQKYDAVVVGVRAYNTLDRLKFLQPQLMQYVKNGGTLVVQYNVSNGLVTPDLGPYPLKLSNDRVTVEDSDVRFLQPNHPVLNTPNKITAQDFKGWVQERGLYFPNQWDPEYEAILSSNDPGETAKEGGLLVAKYGKGHFVYTGYSFFRELPAGVPGAYRLFVNLLSLGKTVSEPVSGNRP
ncbi:PIG-L family deacetylase [Rufibacter glacialis]|uniref:PIG-L family deacetylase n=1 Tax=Rufibacter glacialis TaxID=1259555 RepID=A0A5M8QKU3_9BACT|nr:PIG-L family deacetylase [Rufibacter glacialis]KAA6435848.1 PIG-L family deacetylase [Rufibacter glacialis]